MLNRRSLTDQIKSTAKLYMGLEALNLRMETNTLVIFIMACSTVQYGFDLQILGKGKFVWKNEVVYDGEFTYNKIQGIGTYRWPDGSVFTGSVVNGLRHGDGKFIASGESAIYEG